MTTSYFIISCQTVIAAREPGAAKWRERIFARMVRNSATPNRVVELGSQVEI
jgi:KUP system potassium uptake protein